MINLKKEIIEILTDYKYNTTKTETTEMFADKIIDKALSTQKQEFIEMIKQEIAETPNDNDCCRSFLINVRDRIKNGN